MENHRFKVKPLVLTIQGGKESGHYKQRPNLLFIDDVPLPLMWTGSKCIQFCIISKSLINGLLLFFSSNSVPNSSAESVNWSHTRMGFQHLGPFQLWIWPRAPGTRSCWISCPTPPNSLSYPFSRWCQDLPQPKNSSLIWMGLANGFSLVAD